MPTIAHLSDIHFGHIDEVVLAGLREHLRGEPADFYAVSGDLTMRARDGQYREAVAFLEELKGPRIVVPGNHDVPLFHVWNRMTRPLGSYRRFVGADRTPLYKDEQLCAVGLTTPRRFRWRLKGFWKDGALSDRAVDEAAGLLQRSDAPVKLVVLHHPVTVEDDRHREEIASGAERALPKFAAAGADAFLYGHLHLPHVKLVTALALQSPRTMLCVMAGTACSDRRRQGVPNSYNRLWFDGDRCGVEVVAWDGSKFVASERRDYRRDPTGWQLPAATVRPATEAAAR